MFAFRGVVVQAPLLTVLSRLPEVRFPPVLKPDNVIQFVWAQGYGVLMPIRSGNQVFRVSAPWES
jgi:hypothetical protein